MGETMTDNRDYVLVYQGGIANVFHVERMGFTRAERGETTRELQGAFTTCANFASGLRWAGANVRTASANVAGDVALADWTPGLDDCPFRDHAREVNS